MYGDMYKNRFLDLLVLVLNERKKKETLQLLSAVVYVRRGRSCIKKRNKYNVQSLYYRQQYAIYTNKYELVEKY